MSASHKPDPPLPLRWIDAGVCVAPGVATALSLCAAAARERRLLPLDPPEADTDCAAMALGTPPGPRAAAYGAAGAWLVSLALIDGQILARADLATLGAGGPPAAIRWTTWRTVPLPQARRVLVAEFRSAAAVAGALATLRQGTPPELIAAELTDPSISAWLSGLRRGGAWVLYLALEGETDPVARASRRAWQLLELAGGAPETLRGPHRLWGPVHPPTRRMVVRRSFRIPAEGLASLVDAIRTLHPRPGEVAFRAHALQGILHVYLPPGPEPGDVAAGLEREAQAMGARPLGTS